MIRKRPADLTHAQLRKLVERLQEILYWDATDQHWNPDKEWDSDTLEQIGLLMEGNQLAVKPDPE